MERSGSCAASFHRDQDPSANSAEDGDDDNVGAGEVVPEIGSWQRAQNFTGEGATELVKLHDAGIIRIMDILILAKDEDGSVEAMELSDLPDLGELQRVEAQLAQTLAEEDVAHLAAAMDPGRESQSARWTPPSPA